MRQAGYGSAAKRPRSRTGHLERGRRHLPAGRLMKNKVFERWAESRHAQMGEDNTGHEGNWTHRYRAQKAQGFNKEHSSSAVERS